jgi:outer membrane biogenesis lipoprotein LolB
MKRISLRSWLAVLLCAMLTACASTGTHVTTTSDTYKMMADSQQAWCSQFGCGCTLDDKKATCALVSTCLNTGSCSRAP